MATKIFLAHASEDSLSSRSVGKTGYVQVELREALAAFAERAPGSIYVVPVRLDECEVPDLQIPNLGLSLRDIHRVDLWQDGGFERLISDLQHALGVAPTPEAPQESAPPAEGGLVAARNINKLRKEARERAEAKSRAREAALRSAEKERRGQPSARGGAEAEALRSVVAPNQTPAPRRLKMPAP